MSFSSYKKCSIVWKKYTNKEEWCEYLNHSNFCALVAFFFSRRYAFRFINDCFANRLHRKDAIRWIGSCVLKSSWKTHHNFAFSLSPYSSTFFQHWPFLSQLAGLSVDEEVIDWYINTKRAMYPCVSFQHSTGFRTGASSLTFFFFSSSLPFFSFHHFFLHALTIDAPRFRNYRREDSNSNIFSAEASIAVQEIHKFMLHLIYWIFILVKNLVNS